MCDNWYVLHVFVDCQHMPIVAYIQFCSWWWASSKPSTRRRIVTEWTVNSASGWVHYSTYRDAARSADHEQLYNSHRTVMRLNSASLVNLQAQAQVPIIKPARYKAVQSNTKQYTRCMLTVSCHRKSSNWKNCYSVPPRTVEDQTWVPAVPVSNSVCKFRLWPCTYLYISKYVHKFCKILVIHKYKAFYMFQQNIALPTEVSVQSNV
jgi:hypothetical protein